MASPTAGGIDDRLGSSGVLQIGRRRAEREGGADASQRCRAEATLRFTGAALAVVGDMTPESGRADVFLDGEPAHAIDAYVAGARTTTTCGMCTA